MKAVVYLDVWQNGFVSAWPVHLDGSGVASTVPQKPEGARRYRVVAEIDDPRRPDADAPATTQEEP